MYVNAQRMGAGWRLILASSALVCGSKASGDDRFSGRRV